MSAAETTSLAGPQLVALSKPIRAHGEEINHLELREPTTEDLMEIGYPFLVMQSETEATGVELRPKVIGAWIVRLGQIPRSSVKEMPMADFGKCQTVIMGFFGESSGEPATEAGKS